MDNLLGRPEHADLQAELEMLLSKKRRDTDDDFRPGMDYIKRWGYHVDETGTVPYTM